MGEFCLFLELHWEGSVPAARTAGLCFSVAVSQSDLSAPCQQTIQSFLSHI